MSTIQLQIPGFSDHAPMPARFAKDNENLSPQLLWSDVPAEAVELVITCEDPDAPSGTFVHWLVAGIDPHAFGIDEGKSPIDAVEGRNSYGELGYGGPQPPIGDDPHRYFFRVHACNKSLDMQEGFTMEQLQARLNECEIAKGTMVGTYQR